jgi:RIO kinase 1
MINLDSILKNYEKKHFHLVNPRQVKSGKEATVFVVNFGYKLLALKVYTNSKTRSFQNTKDYTENKYFRNPSERKSIYKSSPTAKSTAHQSWIRREHYLLDKLYEKGVNVPKAYSWTDESILMDFIGNELVAPRLIDVVLTKVQAKKAFDLILKDIQLMLDFGIVHSDLSAYNILWWKNKAYIIDLPQAIDIRQNPNKDPFLKRDLDNLISYFSKFIDINTKDIYSRFNLV